MKHSTRIVRCKFTNFLQPSPPTEVGLLRYYEGGVSSVFLWDLDDGGFAGVVLLKKCEQYFMSDGDVQV